MVLPIALTTTTTSWPARARGDDAVGDPAELLDVGHRGAAVLLHDDGHDDLAARWNVQAAPRLPGYHGAGRGAKDSDAQGGRPSARVENVASSLSTLPPAAAISVCADW